MMLGRKRVNDSDKLGLDRRRLREQAISLLPAVEAEPVSYEHDLDRILDGAPPPAPLLLAVLAELWRRLDVASEGIAKEAIEAAGDRVERELVARRAESELEQLKRRDQAEPLKRRLLYALAREPSGPTALATEVGATKEAVSRVLSQLESGGLVVSRVDPDDRRRRVFSLTPAGGVARREQMALPVENVDEFRLAAARPFLEGALEEAVNRRRYANDLEDAIARLRQIKSEARKVQASDLEVRAHRELATSLRQASLDEEFDTEMQELWKIARGEDPAVGPQLAVPAHGHIAFEVGRLCREDGEAYLAARLDDLTAAHQIFATLSRDRVLGDDWRSRQAWALYGLGDARRLRTEFGAALTDATRALRLFTELEDVYGITSALFLAGVCLRLRGQFAESLAVLSAALANASDDGFFRLQADLLMQLGEANRCVGRLDDAERFLSEAISRAEQLNATVTLAFARSSLAAATYERGRLGESLELFGSARSLFEQRGHRAGLALNMRREAVLQRSLLAESSSATDDASELLQKARSGYGRLDSPAGVVACYVEEGRLALDAGRKLRPSWRRELLGWMTPFERSELIGKDPWVPAILPGFARALGDAELITLSETVEQASTRRREARQEKWNEMVQLLPVSVSPVQHRTEPDVMAGEPRRLIAIADPLL
jgi:DNA-binding MarR family transcriptional regulator